MSASAESNPKLEPDIQVPMPVVTKFLRQLGHDLRNHLNAAELQSAYLAEIAQDPELVKEIKRLRPMISEIGASLERLTASLGTIKLTLMSYDAADFVEDLRHKLAADYPKECSEIEWNLQIGSATLQIDPQSLQAAMIELFANAFRHDRAEGNIAVEAVVEGDQFIFKIREPKRNFQRSTDKWGLEPFQSVGHGHYGLGLHRSRAIIDAHKGQLKARYDSPAATLITTVVLPLASPAE